MTNEEFRTYQLGDWELQSGEKLLNAHLAYKTFGDPSFPAVVYPTWFSGRMSLPFKTTYIYAVEGNTNPEQ